MSWRGVWDPKPKPDYRAGEMVIYKADIWITIRDLDSTVDLDTQPPGTGQTWIKLSAPTAGEVSTEIMLPGDFLGGDLEAILRHIWDQLGGGQ